MGGAGPLLKMYIFSIQIRILIFFEREVDTSRYEYIL